ncbi:inactive C-alpha-formylglycine-generating enzyme 2-like [Psammomys obesus]|uniref:inactive C-alpha-formylglycine-generating enzyme 2-like n=1 Tax=Psammomys obesus TaxID=48139 RepID=UPI002452E03C|nr:inactive C-alpha-formylglycine-generating enzyme 2-like [Psammomys obesus]
MRAESWLLSMGSCLPVLSLLWFLFNPKLQLGNAQAPAMVQLPGGRFLMGTDAPDGKNEGPAREVTVQSFAIDVFPVTNKDFREFVREKKYQTEAEAFGWSFVFEDFVSPELRNQASQMPVREPGLGGDGGWSWTESSEGKGSPGCHHGRADLGTE